MANRLANTWTAIGKLTYAELFEFSEAVRNAGFRIGLTVHGDIGAFAAALEAARCEHVYGGGVDDVLEEAANQKETPMADPNPIQPLPDPLAPFPPDFGTMDDGGGTGQTTPPPPPKPPKPPKPVE